jgi:hypothetical protein
MSAPQIDILQELEKRLHQEAAKYHMDAAELGRQILPALFEEYSQTFREEISKRFLRERPVSKSGPHTEVTPRSGKIVGGKRKASAFGKYAYLPTSSEEFARRKQEEIELEDRRWKAQHR